MLRRVMTRGTLLFALLTVVCFAILRKTGLPLFETFTITAGTFLYHFGVRLLVGTILGGVPLERFHPDASWFTEKPWERRLYRTLRVRSWKDRLPTYDPQLFSFSEELS